MCYACLFKKHLSKSQIMMAESETCDGQPSSKNHHGQQHLAGQSGLN